MTGGAILEVPQPFEKAEIREKGPRLRSFAEGPAASFLLEKRPLLQNGGQEKDWSGK
ncbi:MAG TPA: hypothetical protein VEQ35_06145 [Beijerinckia sp.]|jgi:hypothetical protein|nr:hypothetical protein [Beijerinckia sp.]